MRKPRADLKSASKAARRKAFAVEDPSLYARRKIAELRLSPDTLEEVAETHRRLCETALEELVPALIEAGAQELEARNAAVAIALQVALFRSHSNNDNEPLLRLSEALGALQEAVEALSPSAKIAVQWLLEPHAHEPRKLVSLETDRPNIDLPGPLPLAKTRRLTAVYADFAEALPAISERVNGARLAGISRLQQLIQRTTRVWVDATGEWPSIGITPEPDVPNAPLYHFLNDHCGAHFKTRPWRDYVAAEKERTDRYLMRDVRSPKRGRRKAKL